MASLLTSIVPMFDVERYLLQCLTSILKQDYRPLEIIAVDDGSLDHSGEIADEFALLNGELIVVHQSNKWLGGARNTGLELGSGFYTSFVDSDDYLPPKAYSKMVDFAEEKNCQVVHFGAILTSEDGKEIGKSIPNVVEPDRVYSREEIRKEIYPILIQSHALNGAPFRLYRGINGIIPNSAQFRFREELRYAEDYVSCLDWFPQYESYCLLPEALYCYRTNPNSIMHAYNPKRIEQLVVLYEIREVFMSKQGLCSIEEKKHSAELLMKLVLDQLLLLVAITNMTFANKRHELEKVCQNQSIQEATGRLSKSAMSTWGCLGRWSIRAIRCKSILPLYLLLKLQVCLSTHVS